MHRMNVRLKTTTVPLSALPASLRAPRPRLVWMMFRLRTLTASSFKSTAERTTNRPIKPKTTEQRPRAPKRQQRVLVLLAARMKMKFKTKTETKTEEKWRCSW